jgi:hypothetical protein
MMDVASVKSQMEKSLGLTSMFHFLKPPVIAPEGFKKWNIEV